MTLSEYDAYITAIDDMENRTIDDANYPVVKDSKIKQWCKYSLEVSNLIITYLNVNIHASEKEKKAKANMNKTPIPEDYELSDEEPTTIKLDKEQKLTSKFITFDCPLCKGELQMRNEVEINPKGIKCKCNQCGFKISKSDKTMKVSKDDDGCITLESEIHSISFGWNKQITPPTEDEANRNNMISGISKSHHLLKMKQTEINGK